MNLVDSPNRSNRNPLTELRNIGPACASDLEMAGILCLEDLKKLGPKEAFLQILVARKQQGLEIRTCNANYLYALHGAIYDLYWRELAPEEREDYKSFAMQIRNSTFQ